MQIKVPVGVAGIFHNVQVKRSDGTVKFETGEFANLILDQGLTRMVQLDGPTPGTPIACFTSCSVGTGNSSPSATQTSLDNQVANTNISELSVTAAGHNYEEGYIWSRYTYTFGLGAINNQNISELAIGWGGGSNIFSRALIRDVEGNPTSITILSDEQLIVTWEHRRYWPTEDIVGTIANVGNKGGTFQYTVRPADISLWTIGGAGRSGLLFTRSSSSSYNIGSPGYFNGSSVLGEINGRPSGSGAYYSNTHSWIAPDGNRAMGRMALGVTQGNLAGGIGAIVYGRFDSAVWSANSPQIAFQMAFDPPIPKTSDDVLEIDLFIEPFRV